MEDSPLAKIKAIGFDLFNTLIVARPNTLVEALERLMDSLMGKGIHFKREDFKKLYTQAVISFIQEARKTGKETHNRFWIAKALYELGYPLSPHGPEVASAIEAYFSAFFEYCRLIPGTQEALGILAGNYPLGLLTNFTDAEVGKRLVKHFDLEGFFSAVVISGEIGYRKPHPRTFQVLMAEMGFEASDLVYVGDDPAPDIEGARKAGIRPVWFTYAQDHGVRNIPMAFPTDLTEPNIPVIRVSTWEEFLSLFPGKA